MAVPTFRFCTWDLALDTEPVIQFGRFAAHAATWFPSAQPGRLVVLAFRFGTWALALDTEPVTQFGRFAAHAATWFPSTQSGSLGLLAFRFWMLWLSLLVQERSVGSAALPRAPQGGS